MDGYSNGNASVDEQQRLYQEQINKTIDDLNKESSNKNGQWINTSEYGIVWKPNENISAAVPPEKVPTILNDIIKWGEPFHFDDLKQNSVVIIKLNTDDSVRTQTLQRMIAQMVLNPRKEILKEKHACVLFLSSDDDISVMDETDMNQAGWEKKEKSRIITSLR